MTFVVAGASGNTGKVAAETLLGMGKAVRVLVRDAAKAAAFREKGAEVAVANLEDPASLTSALEGAEGAYLLVPPNFQTADFLAYQRRVVDALSAAVQATKLPHAVLLSSVGAELAEGNGPIRGLHYAESRLRDVGATRWTFLRAAYFMENLGGSFGMLEQGLLPVFGSAQAAFPMIATRDIGAAAARLLVEPSSAHEIVNLAGPSYSFAHAAEFLSKILGKPIQTLEIDVAKMAESLVGFGVPAQMAGLYQEMTESMLAGRLTFQEGPRRLIGPTPLDTVLSGLLKR